MNKDEIAGLVGELHALYVWPQFVADHHADVLLPRQTKGLYDVGKLADKAADALTTLSARVETLEAQVQAAAKAERDRIVAVLSDEATWLALIKSKHGLAAFLEQNS